MKLNCKGHSLIELLIAMTLSMLIIAALVPINMLSLKSLIHIEKTEKQINQLSQSVKLLENDLKALALTGCALDKALIFNRLTDHTLPSSSQTPIQWISGYSNNSWHPHQPMHTSSTNVKSIDAIHLLKTDMSKPLSKDNISRNPERVVFITNCEFSEITRAFDSALLKKRLVSSEIFIYAFQFIHYYIKDIQGKQILYRQYLGKSGHSVNEPLVDNIDQITIGYGEKLATNGLVFRSAEKVGNWANIAIVYISITLAGAMQTPLCILVTLNNHVYTP